MTEEALAEPGPFRVIRALEREVTVEFLPRRVLIAQVSFDVRPGSFVF